MADVDYERDEQMLEARRLKRLEMRRKRMIQKRITLGVALLVLVVLVVVIVRSCGGDTPETENADPPPTVPENNVQLPVEPEPKTSTATLAAVGDIMVYDSQLEDARKDDGTYDFLPCFAPVGDLLAAADITVGNFEANFAGSPYSGKPDFRAPEDLAKTLGGLGFDILQTANTYSIQNGIESGLTNTINVIRGAGMDTLGTYLSAEDRDENQVVLKEANGIKVAFIAFTKGLNSLSVPEDKSYCVDLMYTDYNTNFRNVNRAALTSAVEKAKGLEPDVIVAMLHWGSEYVVQPSASQNEVAELLINAGVDVILGTHPHVVGPMEQRTVTVDGQEKNVFIAYSLGNFMAAMGRDDPYLEESVILNLEFTKDQNAGTTTISAVNYVPVYQFDNGEGAINRYEVRSAYDVLASDPDEDTKKLMEDTIALLKTNTASAFDRGN